MEETRRYSNQYSEVTKQERRLTAPFLFQMNYDINKA